MRSPPIRETVERIDGEQGALASELLRHYENADERDRRIDYLTDALITPPQDGTEAR